MCDPTGVHITRIYVNRSRQSPSPIRSSNTVPVCTSTPIINVGPFNPSAKQQMGLLAKEILKSQRSLDTFIQKPESPKQQTTSHAKEVVKSQPSSDTFIQKAESPKLEEYVFTSKETGQKIDFTTGEGIGKIINPNTETISKKKKNRQSLAVVPPPQSNRMYIYIYILNKIFSFIKAHQNPVMMEII
jgi:hypothetical protein